MTAEPDDITAILPDFAYWQLSHDLTGGLPPPTPDTPEQRTIRDHAAVAQVAAMQPANSMEIQVAVRAVQAAFHAMDASRAAADPSTTPEHAAKCRAQAAFMDRQADSAIRLLLRMQAARFRIEANQTALDRGLRIEHITATLMTQALHAPPLPPVREGTDGRFVSPYDRISRNHANEIPTRQPAPTTIDASALPEADSLPHDDPEAAPERAAPRPQGKPLNLRSGISKTRSESHKCTIEMPARQSSPPEDLSSHDGSQRAIPGWRPTRPDPFDPERPYGTDYYLPDQSPPLIDSHGRPVKPPMKPHEYPI